MNQEVNQYNVYRTEKLIEVLSNITEKNDEVTRFFQSFSFNNVINQNIDKGNSAYVFKNAIKDDNTRSKITLALNKLHQQNLTKIITMIREIVFQTQDELNELVNQCIQKIKRDNDQIKPLVAALCWELLSTYFMSATGEKIYFRKLLLTSVKNDYVESTNFTNDDWSKEKGEKSMVLIGVLFNNKIIDQKIMGSIINDYKNRITFVDNGTQEQYEIVEKSIHQLSCLISSIIINDDSIKVYEELDTFLEKQMELYEEKKCISKKIRLVCKNCIEELRKYK
jgi:hypothetical protein